MGGKGKKKKAKALEKRRSVAEEVLAAEKSSDENSERRGESEWPRARLMPGRAAGRGGGQGASACKLIGNPESLNP